jgi:gluconate 2-dehydrogenase alpha chain
VATRLKHRTVVFVGGGFTAALAARQLTAKGVNVVVLERGIDRTHTAATSLPSQRDELRWDVHGDLFQDWSVQTYTLRHNDGETALPIRRLQAFKPGEGMGGAANH